MRVLVWIAVGILAYLIGTIPFGYLAGRLVAGVDVRQKGSGSTGATNVLRTAGLGPSLLVFIADLGKGAAAAGLGIWLLGPTWGPVLTGNMAVIGHSWPIYLGFKGGRGVLTGLGALFVLSPWLGLAALLVAVVVTAPTRYVSAGSLAGVLTGVGGLTIMGALGSKPLAFLLYGWVAGPLIIIRHRGNIIRLIRGTESKLGQRAKKQDPQSQKKARNAWQR
ncbi:MAG: glycerol-3-phosphate 1-O-acyltransferase PlsY [Chloroflexi bacterium]|nr:glycerol-3-phosphate 1-O-acyltransferase PlsY [Chloroflexota bacterium]